LHALTAQAAFVLEARRLQNEAARATELAQANDLRAGLLQAVSHDLRTPLASLQASIPSLRPTRAARPATRRPGLRQAVSHAPRTPLASIKASITSLRQTDVAWGPVQQAEFF